MRHVRYPFFGVVDRLDDGGGQFLEGFGESVFFGCCFTAGCSGFGVGGDGSVRIETSDGAVAFLEDAVAFFQHGLDVLDELFLVELFFWCSVGFFDTLLWLLVEGHIYMGGRICTSVMFLQMGSILSNVSFKM